MRRWGLLAAVIALAGCGESENLDDIEARLACEDAVETQLRAPSTAEFSGHDETTIAPAGSVYAVRGWVDAQNGFGAAIRSEYVCEIRDVGDGWELVDLRVG